MQGTDTSLQRRSCRQGGIGLLEVLVAVVLISIGIVGAVSMTAKSIRQSSYSNQQILAATVARELVERLRANLPGVNDGDYDNPAAVDCAVPPVKSCEFSVGDTSTATRCTSAEMAAFDIYAISCSDQFQSLPSANLSIDCNPDGTCAAESMHRVTIDWTLPPGGAENQRKVVFTFFPGPEE